MELFKLPRTLGVTADGETVITNVGRFGPYVKYGSKYVSLKEDDPYDVTLERALEVIRLKQEADANRTITDFGVDGIQVLNGRYGPYVTDGKKNAKIPKDRDPKTLTLEECRVLIEQAPARGAGRFGRGKRGAPGGKAAAGSRAAGAAANGKAGANGTDGGATGATAGEKASKGKRPRPSAPATAGASAKSATAGAKSAATAAGSKSTTPPARATGTREQAGSPKQSGARPAAKAPAGSKGTAAPTRQTNSQATCKPRPR
jgi:DNA topoisomerase-1